MGVVHVSKILLCAFAETFTTLNLPNKHFKTIGECLDFERGQGCKMCYTANIRKFHRRR